MFIKKGHSNMLANQGRWNELAEPCKGCIHIKAMSLHMDGNHIYGCCKYPLKHSNEVCPKMIPKDEE